MAQFSKPIGKGDDAVKDLLMAVLGDDHTHGFDIDSIYYDRNSCWVILEFLKCETVRPFNSHPSRYWDKNWRKFASLWEVSTKLGGRLYLVNYEVPYDQFRVIRVEDLDPSESGGIKRETVKCWHFAEFTKWFRALNSSAKAPWDSR